MFSWFQGVRTEEKEESEAAAVLPVPLGFPIRIPSIWWRTEVGRFLLQLSRLLRLNPVLTPTAGTSKVCCNSN
jgi:hypothetical protein